VNRWRWRKKRRGSKDEDRKLSRETQRSSEHDRREENVKKTNEGSMRPNAKLMKTEKERLMRCECEDRTRKEKGDRDKNNNKRKPNNAMSNCKPKGKDTYKSNSKICDKDKNSFRNTNSTD
jgi:hypothetical protein